MSLIEYNVYYGHFMCEHKRYLALKKYNNYMIYLLQYNIQQLMIIFFMAINISKDYKLSHKNILFDKYLDCLR